MQSITFKFIFITAYTEKNLNWNLPWLNHSILNLVLDQAQTCQQFLKRFSKAGMGWWGQRRALTKGGRAPEPPASPAALFTTCGPSAMSSPRNHKHSRFKNQRFWEDTRLSPQLPAMKWVLYQAGKWIQSHPALPLDKPEVIQPVRDPRLCRLDPPTSFPPSKLVQCSLCWQRSRKSNQYIKQKSSQNSSNWPNLTFS